MQTSLIAVPAVIIAAAVTMLALVSPVHGVAPSAQHDCRRNDCRPWFAVGLNPADRTVVWK